MTDSRSNPPLHKDAHTPVHTHVSTPVVKAPVVVPAPVVETKEEKEIRDLHARMATIERELGGFSNIPPVRSHEYWGIRDRLQQLLMNRK